MNHPTPSPDDTEELLLACRYGDIEDVTSFFERFGTAPMGDARDENGNTNHAGSTALHWAALNSQLATARALVNFPGGLGIDLIDIKNAAGRSSLAEAEVAGWDEGAKWMVEVMRLDDAGDVEGDTPLSEDQVEVEDTDGRTACMPPASVEKPREEDDSLPS
ncbi:hypothetical protein BJV78DRAFT_1191363 [Lactifluus subvellereus]|nr:hypothetical protein BJV78DRAFT_1191363 [Lactifluus subvellereus]